ncbi:efflux RND transporter periplasmic adaptor subunit [Calycomorphotria hydatis]|uniref:HlyD family secretion protein n=1 Tax=Calycomorphotria hydatis TaxID=2528027 RepID=A0A517T904_9PLAN|nr:efflux RND transporter periplasmic adaptor subunit [Calycomorphotria hydatis]QDT64860.1 HlyD family secretion protein [Calycomorphotria hydatis]
MSAPNSTDATASPIDRELLRQFREACSLVPSRENIAVAVGVLRNAIGAHRVCLWNRQNDEFQLVLHNSEGSDNSHEQLGQHLNVVVAAIQHVRTQIVQLEQSNASLVLAIPFYVEDSSAALEVVFEESLPEKVIAVLREAIEWAVKILAEFVQRSSLPSPTPHFWQAAHDYSISLQRTLQLNNVARVVANDAAVLLGCDRLSVVLKRGPRARVQAVTGQSEINRRGDCAKSIRQLAQQLMRHNELLEFNGTQDEYPPYISKSLADVVRVNGTKVLFAVPLCVPEKEKTGEEGTVQKKTSPENIPYGCLIAEWFQPSPPTEDVKSKLNSILPATTQSLWNARQLSRIPFWRAQHTIGSALAKLRERYRYQSLAIITALAVAIVLCIFMTLPYRITAEGELLPDVRRRVFAAIDGDVREVHVDGGEQVTEGQLLFTLKNEELEAEIISVNSEVGEKRQQLRALIARWDEAVKSARRADAIDLQGEIESMRVELNGLERRQDVLKEREKLLAVKSPIAGTVASFQIAEKLIGKPVSRGEYLTVIMDETGPWRLELAIPENRISQVKKNLNEQSLDGPATDTNTRYIVLTDPEVSYESTLTELSTRVEPSRDGDPTVDGYARLAKAQPTLRIGAKVRARVDCGPRSLGYVLFGDVIDFVRRYLWF